MQQRQPRLGDVLDDYCPRERRLTNHVVVAMIGDAVKQTRCTTCDADHEYKQARLPRLRRKTETPAALAAQGFGAPKLHDHAKAGDPGEHAAPPPPPDARDERPQPIALESDAPADADTEVDADEDSEQGQPGVDEGPVHRRLIRASLPRIEGQVPASRPNPEFTIRQPNNSRQNRFRPRNGRGGGPMQSSGGGNGNRSFGGGYPQQRQPGNHQGGRRRGRSK